MTILREQPRTANSTIKGKRPCQVGTARPVRTPPSMSQNPPIALLPYKRDRLMKPLTLEITRLSQLGLSQH
ncbi:hypothetical protein FGO68_gene11399 [Halteria grandinella]|uniref:Uncharacterized protein n=1 Tax=Halteria grandinella TaxID=5974 RepID=A0A8J8T3K3_HALGN|nr:hypothetical protein FGO68_gene11399 [Halteria grandinella]